MPGNVDDLAGAIRLVQSVEWTLLALAALNVWRKSRTTAATWLSLTFGALALVVIAGLVLPENQTELTIFIRLLLAVLALFPYFLYRFVVSMVERHTWVWAGAHVLTAAAIAAMFLLSALPQPGEPRTLGFLVFVLVFVLQWAFLLVYSALSLWRAGSGQPAVARNRMRTIAFAATLLAVVVVTSASAPSSDQTRPVDIVTSAIGLLAAPLFFFGFDPPRLLRLIWRQREEAELRTTEIGLVRAISRPEVADAWLPRVSELIGGERAVLFDIDKSVLATHRFAEPEIERARLVLPPSDTPRYRPVDAGPYQVLTMHNGWLVIATGPLTPFFGDDELSMLGASSVVADLALGRARLFELEQDAREAMRDFVAIASHDLRTPVTVIAGFSDLMQMQWDTISDDDKLHYLQAIGRQVTHLNRLIDDLLTVSKLDVRELDAFPQPVDVQTVARDVVDELGMEANVMVTGANVRPFVMADADHVSRMIRNYLTNAETYGSAPIAIDIAADNGSVTIRVRDAGPGVPADFVPRLFEKFARLDKKKSKAVQGTGLGLSIVRGLARNNGGEAWYEPNQPSGACFCVRLPAASVPTEAAHV